MTFSPDIVLFLFFIQMLGYTIKGLIGFGNPLVTAPLLSLRLDTMLITPGSLLMDAPINAYIVWRNRRSFNFRRVLPMLLAVVAGVVPGTLLLRFSMPWIIKTVLGAVVVFLGVEMATRRLRGAPAGGPNPVVQTVVAFLSGVCAGLFGINMFIIAYLERTAKDYGEFKGSMCFLFLGENLFRLCVYLVSGIITRDVLLFGLISLPAAGAGMALSGLLAPHLDEKKLKTGAIALFILSGVSTIVKSLLFHT